MPSASDDDAPASITMRVAPDVELPGCFAEIVESEAPDKTDEYDTFWLVHYQGGHEVLEEGTDDSGDFWGRNVFEYEDGNLVHAVYDDVRQEIEPDWHLWMTYDTSGNRLTYSADDDADPEEEWRATYEYDSEGTLVEAELDSFGPATPWKRSYEYDGDGRLARVEQDYGLDEEIDSETTYEYDDTQRVITSTTTDPSGTEVRNGRTEYDEEDRKVFETTTDVFPDSATYTFSETHTYEAGRLEETVYANVTLDADGGLVNRNQTTRNYIFGDLCIR